MANNYGNPFYTQLWAKHKDDTPYCMCRTCFYARQQGVGALGRKFLFTAPTSPLPKTFEERIADDINALMKDVVLDGASIHVEGIELPTPEPDLTTYQDALARAIKKCPHDNVTNTLYMKEFQCDDCGKYFNLTEYKKILNQKRFMEF